MNTFENMPEEIQETQVSTLTAEELRIITKKYTAKLAILFQEYFEETNFAIDSVTLHNLYHLQTDKKLPSEILINICPARSYLKHKE